MAERRRPKWWVYAVLACCASYVLVFLYVLAAGPEPSGLRFERRATGALVTGVEPGSLGDRAGVREGDLIVSVNGRSGPSAWGLETRAHFVGRRLELAIERGTERRTVHVTFGRKGGAYWTSADGLAQLAEVPVALLSTLLAWLIALRRPDESTARLGALMLALLPVGESFAITGAPPGLLAAVSRLPAPVALLPTAATLIAATAVNPIALMFFASFPGRELRGRRVWALAWVPSITAALPPTLVLLYNQVFLPDPPLPLHPAVRMLVPVAAFLWLVVACFVPVLLVRNYRALSDPGERRRIRVMVAGIVIGAAASLPDLLLRQGAVTLSRQPLPAAYSAPFVIAVGALNFLWPAVIAYAILQHRVFDVGVILRQGLQYAVARRLVLALAPLFVVALVADLALHSDQPMAQAFLARGWLYAVLAAAAFLAHVKSRTWLPALDRAFFRERYDAQRILRGLLADVRETADLGAAATRAISQIEAALHPEFAAILVRLPDELSFRVSAVAGSLPAPPEIRADGKLMALVRVLGKPVELSQSDTGWLRRQLPAEETDGLARARVEWLFPIALGKERVEGLLALAPKRSEEPYTQEDQDLVEAIASGLAVVAERTTAAVSSRAASAAGPFATAETAVFAFGRRYTVRRELGRGGMGSVYEAYDSELERAVAIKVIRPDLLASTEAAARFKREARAAAGFSHPNVVTIHDFSVAEDGRAYLVMELLAGCSLREALRRDGRFAPPRARAVLCGVGAAVEAAHERHLLHRDLKPENVFLVGSGEIPKVLDFGVAKPLDAGTAGTVETGAGRLVGTLAYMSPEQLQGGPPEPAWDLWALTVITYEMLTGQHPFAGIGRAVPAAVPAGRTTPPSALLGEDGPRWDELFLRALGSDPSERPTTPRDLLARFDAAATS